MQSFFNCPVGCAAQTLPALPEDPRCISVPGYSQVWGLVIAPCASEDPFALDSNAAILSSTAIDNTNANNTAPRLLVGKGEVAEHEATEYEGPLRKRVISQRGYTLNFEVTATDPLQYEFLRALQCNFQAFRFWYMDMADFLYGKVVATGVGGILPAFVNVQMPKGGGRDDLQSMTISISWDSRTGDPDRYASPILSLAGSCEPEQGD